MKSNLPPPRDMDATWAEPLAGQLATLRALRGSVNVLATVAGLSLVIGVIAWLATSGI